MTWEWSHSQEAYTNAYENLHDKPIDWLAEVYAEWLAEVYAEWVVKDEWDDAIYEATLSRAKQYGSFALAERIWRWMESQRTCDNGGHNAWACPTGCHTVSFSREED